MIAIVDYGLGNIKAFSNIYNRLNIDCYFASSQKDLEGASKIILPGVGSFDHAMNTLNNSGLREQLDYMVLEKHVPVLGVCVGMQMMANTSEEGRLPGLGWIPGHVRRLNVPQGQREYPLPHMGWNMVSKVSSSPLMSGLGSESKFYFLHSYFFEVEEQKFQLATASYGETFSCIVNNNNAYGVQCHPEKSHNSGIELLKSFSEI